MGRARWIAGSVVLLGLGLYASIFPIAEIFTEVVVLRTRDGNGASHETRLSIIDRKGVAWVRGRPYRGWFLRVEANPCVELFRAEVWRPMRATISHEPEDAAAFDQVMLESHGLVYRYIDVIARISATEIPVRLEPRRDTDSDECLPRQGTH
jgi:hypothetical protein